MRALLLMSLLLTACVDPVASRLEFMSPELKKTGLHGKTIAVGPIVCADWHHDPTFGDAAVLQTAAEKHLQRLRPGVQVMDALALERLAGAMKSRLVPGADDLLSRVVNPAQFRLMAGKGVTHLLLTEVIGNRTSQKYGLRTQTETQEETDADGNTRTCTTTSEYAVATASRFITLRLYLIDTATRATVWRTRSSGQHQNEKEKAVSFLEASRPSMPEVPPLSDIADSLLTKPLKKLPKG